MVPVTTNQLLFFFSFNRYFTVGQVEKSSNYSAMDPPPTGLPKPRIGAAHSYLTAMMVSIPWGHCQVIGDD
jgi:hypothetical protein